MIGDFSAEPFHELTADFGIMSGSGTDLVMKLSIHQHIVTLAKRRHTVKQTGFKGFIGFVGLRRGRWFLSFEYFDVFRDSKLFPGVADNFIRKNNHRNPETLGKVKGLYRQFIAFLDR